MPDNAGDRKDIRRREKQAKLEAAQREAFVRQLMSTVEGRAWLWGILSQCHCFTTTYIPGDALATAFSEGQRSIGLSILADVLTSAPDSYIQAMRESYVRDATDEQRSRTVADGRDSGSSPSPDSSGDSGSGESSGVDYADDPDNPGPGQILRSNLVDDAIIDRAKARS